MKTFKNSIKVLLILSTMIVCVNSYSQTEFKTKQLFVRVYNLEGKKINKGKVFSVTDSTITLTNNSKTTQIAINEIGIIKTKRSEGNNLIMGALIGATSGAILGAATADPNDWVLGYTSAEGAIGGGILGGVGGAAIGGITILFKKSETFIIKGNKDFWKIFVELIEGK